MALHENILGKNAFQAVLSEVSSTAQQLIAVAIGFKLTLDKTFRIYKLYLEKGLCIVAKANAIPMRVECFRVYCVQVRSDLATHSRQ